MVQKKYEKEDILRLVEENDIKFIRLQFVDILGTLKNVAVTVEQLEKALNDEIMFDGSSIEGFLRSEEADMYLKPDLDTFEIFPWRPQQGKVARLICDIYKADGNPFEGDPRYVLKKVLNEAWEMGYELNIGTEFEFFLFHTDENGNPTTITHDKAGYFDLGPLDLGENVRRDIVLTLEDMGFEIEASHHEVAPGQHEIDFKQTNALRAADNITTFKLVVKVIAQRHGLHATFMPKPVYGMHGSGMHCNLTLKNTEGKNIFYNKDDKLKLSDEAYQFIGGLLKNARALTSITNPTVNSYKRLVPGHEAPTFIGYSTNNNSTLIRIPTSRGEDIKLELRGPDPSANPYLAIAAILKSGLDGLKNKTKAPDEVSHNELKEKNYSILDEEKSLPVNLKDAIMALSKNEVLKDALGECYDNYVKSKDLEWIEYSSKIHQWELNKYISRY
ncbi:glutamine synthetase [Natranaerovirga hydrolytica]|uniref:Glutamine synthetase n=1 Tax=Natranaerovirga hydrolytica TaxID=680378 RepID=A0A4V2Q056_9FIRM|nr:type I glutamate--ammonia ligase [Natranaerovirga hydrolytica]TCK92431.1 glutamine synthetase [Natranaerovirga hydrolytica]